jgi:YHS domain-containing protein
MTADVAALAVTAQQGGRRYVFCSAGCRDAFTADQVRYTGQENISLHDPARRA